MPLTRKRRRKNTSLGSNTARCTKRIRSAPQIARAQDKGDRETSEQETGAFPPEFKYKQNKIQFDINKSVMEKIKNALEISDDEERSATLNEGKNILVQRKKHIKLAEKYSWETVDCHVEEPLASDSDNDKKICRAIKESKVMKEEKRKSARTVVKPQSVQSRLGSPAGLDVATCGVANATGFEPLAINFSLLVASLATAILSYFIYFFIF